MKFDNNKLSNVRIKTPLIQFITNYVTVNDCANITLACGGSPIMSDEIKETEQMASMCDALVINIGTVNERTLSSMLCAGRKANSLGTPVILDPVGAGASDFRNNAVNLLLKEVNFSVIKGNISEIKYISYGITSTQGVDACAADLVNEENLMDTILFAQKLSIMTGSVITITGPIDIVVDNKSGYAIRNGHVMMPMITGTGCMSGAVAGCFVGADPDCSLDGAVTAAAAMGICGELAYERLVLTGGGTATFRTLITDEMSKLTDDKLREHIRLQKII